MFFEIFIDWNKVAAFCLFLSEQNCNVLWGIFGFRSMVHCQCRVYNIFSSTQQAADTFSRMRQNDCQIWFLRGHSADNAKTTFQRSADNINLFSFYPLLPRTSLTMSVLPADNRGQTADNKYLQLFTPTPLHQKDRRGSGDKLSHTSVLLPATTHAPSSARALNAGMQPNCGDPAPQEVYKLSWWYSGKIVKKRTLKKT